MVAWGEPLLGVIAYASAIVATLRAGSRALYLKEHDSIGVMEGPVILAPHDVQAGRKRRGEPDSQVSPFWEVAFLFERSVRLAFDADKDERVAKQVDARILAAIDPHKGHEAPYSLSLNPVSNVEGKKNDLESSRGFLGRVKQSMPRLSVTSRMHGFATSCLEAPKYLFRWIPSLQSREEIVEEQDEDFHSWIDDNWNQEEEWDYATCLSSEITYNKTKSYRRYARLSVYAPQTFADLRSRFGVNEQDFLRSILESGPFVSFQSNSKGAARSGGIFFFTRDGAYMIKSIKNEEARTLMSMLPKYHTFMKSNARRSLLTRFCGMYGVQLGNSPQLSDRSFFASISDKFSSNADEEHIFVVMNAVFPAEASQFISERFDLKGSTVGRECSAEELAKSGTNAVLKDLDLAREVELVRSVSTSRSRGTRDGFHFGAGTKSSLLSQLRRDIRLLVACSVMDYSLLVGVVHMDSHGVDAKAMRLVKASDDLESKISQINLREGEDHDERLVVSSITAPIRTILAPQILFCRRAFSMVESTLSTVYTKPLPYYGAGICGVNGGVFSVLQGRRRGKRAIYYIGLIDFLQPWTARKILERHVKGMMGYDKSAISCVDPDEYATRFLEFLDAHIS